jgi:tetratricopeptide (TPR) repeat protein
MKSMLYIFLILLLATGAVFAQSEELALRDSTGAVSVQSEAEARITLGDSMYAKYDNPAALNAYLQAIQKDSNNYEANWKAARAFTDIGETLEGKKRSEYFKKGEIYSRRAIKIDSTNSKGHLFLSIALGRVALDAGPKQRIQYSKEIKKEVDLAIKYDPNDDTAYHVLGRWNRKLANLSWVEKTFANIFLGGVPKEASNENAAACFQKAIELNPTHINHYLELGITYDMMGEKDNAKSAFQKCLDLPKSDSDDDTYKKEAEERLKKL